MRITSVLKALACRGRFGGGAAHRGAQLYFMFAVLWALFSCSKMRPFYLKTCTPMKGPPDPPLDLGASLSIGRERVGALQERACRERKLIFVYSGMIICGNRLRVGARAKNSGGVQVRFRVRFQVVEPN